MPMAGIFFAANPRQGADRLTLWIVFALMAAIPMAVIGVIFGAMNTAMEEVEELWREIDRLHGLEE